MYVMFLLLICRRFFRSCDTLVLARLSCCIYCAVMHFPLLLHYDNSSAVHSALL